MPNAIVIGQFERRLVELGCPEKRLQARVRELGDHFLDLQEAALEEGCSESAAAARAAARLGDPVLLAENLIADLRRASWWGRHPLVGFCLLPPVAFVLIWGASLATLLGLSRLEGWLFGPAYRLDGATLAIFQSNPDLFYDYANPLQAGVGVMSAILLTAGSCWLARRSAVGWKWEMAACGACFLVSQLFWSSIEPHKFSLGFGLHSPPEWSAAAVVPLVAAAVIFFWQRSRKRRRSPLPRGARRSPTSRRPRVALLREFCVSPTYWIVTILVAGILWLTISWWPTSSRLEAARALAGIARQRNLEKNVWPGERAATLALLKSRQLAVAPGRETTIDLTSWLNESLNTSTGDPAKMKGNNLASLPAGVHVYAGVPFDVAGRVQLLGRQMTGPAEKLFPAAIRDIAIGRRCDRLHVLQGASGVATPGQKVASLVLYYADGSQAEIGIVAGADLLDWWGPIYNTDAGTGRYTTSAGTELAWAGSNSAIAQAAPEFSLRLYRSTYANPHPELAVVSVDYMSTLTDAAPFLVGLTVEQTVP